jgi:uncharacterized protein YjbJ (UPF0337 family)
MPNPRHEGPAAYLIEGNIDDRSNKGSDSMGWDEIERSWHELRGEVKQQWSKLTDEDVELIKGKYAELLGLLQARYGHAKEQAEQEINDWAKRLKVYSAAELAAFRDDVASLSASVGELVTSNTRPKPKSQRLFGEPCRRWRSSFGGSAS